MKLLVCISKTPDTTSKIAFTEGNTKFDENGVQWIINPYDEWYALVRAIELKEQEPKNINMDLKDSPVVIENTTTVTNPDGSMASGAVTRTNVDESDIDAILAEATAAAKAAGAAEVMQRLIAWADVIVASRKLENCEKVADEVRALGRRALAVNCSRQ